jgi:hypothetical protein
VVSPTTREVEHRGSTYLLPADVTDAELAEGSVLALLLHKLSYEKNTAQPIVLVRKGYEFRQVAVTRLDNTPEGRAARDRDLLDKLVAFIEKKLGAGRKFTKNSLANECTDELGMARDKIRSLVETALEQGRLELAPLPAHERHGSRKEYLRPVNLESA